MPKTVIEQFTSRMHNLFKAGIETHEPSMNKLNTLEVAECFGDTLQGEGIYTGHPATFLRLKGCTLDCVWCDTASVWREGQRYDHIEIIEMLDFAGLLERMRYDNQHLILTGGSPLKQEESLIQLIHKLTIQLGMKPFIEVENECVLMPGPNFSKLVDCWNNSPKLANSGMKKRARYKPDILQQMSSLPNSWFKFVVSSENDWDEIYQDFIEKGLIKMDQIILMPCGENQIELAKTREIAANMAIEQGVRFSDRLHITIWNKKVGV